MCVIVELCMNTLACCTLSCCAGCFTFALCTSTRFWLVQAQLTSLGQVQDSKCTKLCLHSVFTFRHPAPGHTDLVQMDLLYYRNGKNNICSRCKIAMPPTLLMPLFCAGCKTGPSVFTSETKPPMSLKFNLMFKF